MSQYGPFIQKNKADLNKTKIVEAYDDFMYTHKTKLEEEFYALNEFRTSMRGVKVRGVYGNPKEAEIKAKKLQSKDKYHNIFLGEVGKWTPWDPSPNEVKDQEYNNDQLNNLMKKYKENEDSREKFFE
jgi:thymidylate synthase